MNYKVIKYLNKTNMVDFTGEKIYIGIDMHSEQWSVSIRHNQRTIKEAVIEPSARTLQSFLNNNYPGGSYYSVYEAGYFGFQTHYNLSEFGIKNIIVNPADIPTRNKERVKKTDRSDSRKLAQALESGLLEGIYIPTREQIALRNLSRLRQQIVKDKTRAKNRIKAFLRFNGKVLKRDGGTRHWSKSFIASLTRIEFEEEANKIILDDLLFTLNHLSEREKALEMKIKEILGKTEGNKIIERLENLSGIGFKIATAFYLEIMDIKRFPGRNQLAEYVGMTPMVHESGDTELTGGITIRQNRQIRSLLIEAAWVASKSSKYLKKFSQLTKRMKKKKAIIRIAKMLLFDIRREWIISLVS